MKALTIFTTLFLYTKLILCSQKCNPKDNCTCFPGLEVQCPANWTEGDQGFVITISETKIRIDCYKMDTFRDDLLPNITVTQANQIYLRTCPPPSNFQAISDHFSIKLLKELRCESVQHFNLTKTYFEGLTNLEKLKLNELNLTDLDPDVFENTPNLVNVDFEQNRNFTLSRNLFRNLTFLKFLSMAKNHLLDIPEGLFRNLGQLEILHLWSNNLTTITDKTFAGLTGLKSLELMNNKIWNFSEEALKNLTEITELGLSGNNLTNLSSKMFQNNKKLTKVYMSFNPNLTTLPDYLFANLPKLEVVYLTNCGLQFLPPHLFDNSLRLRVLNLKQNQLTLLPPIFSQNLKNLQDLDLSKNLIRIIEEDSLKNVSSLKKIDLSRNRIETIHEKTFYNKSNLREINLAHNRYSKGNLTYYSFGVEILDLSYNLIERMTDVILPLRFLRLKKLDFSHNFIKEVELSELLEVSKDVKVNFDYNNVTRVNFQNVFYKLAQKKTLVFLNNNPIKCDCENYKFLQYLQNTKLKERNNSFVFDVDELNCAKPEEFKSTQVLKLPLDNLTCLLEKRNQTAFCPKMCSCGWRPFDNCVTIDCSYKNLTDYPQLNFDKNSSLKFDQTEMHLEGNYLKIGPQSNLSGYDNITRLYLSFNEIDEVTWLPPRLKVLHLDHNRVEKLGFEVLDRLKGSILENLTIDHNPWSCGCDAENFTNFLRQNTRVVDAKDVYCFNSTRLLLDLNRNDLCEEWQIVNVIVAILFVLLIISVTFALYYRYQTDLKVWLYAHNLCLWWVTEEELDKDKMYDAFISYSHKDEDFVVQNLLPVLEGGPQPYKLCLHIRDFIPGEFITAQITRSVLESRRTLVVLSPHFLESVWGKMEFRTAHTQAMTEGRARVIIVLYGDIDIEKIDDELKSYLKTNTYVKWGDPYFWNKLRYALPHSRRNVANNNQKLANVMRCIDDKFNLVGSNTPSPGTTPPALDPNVLKKHPLNFVPSPELDTPPAESGTLLVSTCL